MSRLDDLERRVAELEQQLGLQPEQPFMPRPVERPRVHPCECLYGRCMKRPDCGLTGVNPTSPGSIAVPDWGKTR